MRLAWFTPLPPVTSGIAGYSVEALPAVAAAHEVDVFVASAAERDRPSHGGASVRDAHEFAWRHHRQPYDLVVYQMGNAWCHDYMWPYVFRYPGLVVLHDAHLHHARAWSLLGRRRQEDYRAEFIFNHPDVPPEAAEVGLSGFNGLVYYFWPMLRAVVTSARAVAVHSGPVAAELAAAFPAVTFETIRMGVADPGLQPLAERARLGAAVRARHAVPADALVLAAYGGVTPEKRISQLLRAAAATRPYRPDLHVLLVGSTMAHYDAAAEAAAVGITDRVIITGFVPEADLPAYLAAADVAVCLRWPTARETSASWLRAMAAGQPTIVTDLAHQGEIATLDPRTWTVVHAGPTLALPDPVAVSIDILDEDHSLRLALRRLATDADLRARVGRAARAHWAARHTVAYMAADYLGVLERTAARAAPAVTLPAHLRPDPLAHARALVAPLGVDLGLDAF